MFEIDRWQEIFYSIGKNKLRTFLSGFTIALGLFIFIILFGFGNGLQNGFMSQFIRDATNIINFYPGRTTKAYKGMQENRNITFKNEDLEVLSKKYKNQLQYKTGRLSSNSKVIFGAESGSYSVEGVYPEKQYLEKAKVINGRFFSYNDMQNRYKVAIIGRLVEKDLFKHENALNKYIDINGINYQVIGVFSDDGGDREERIIYVPLTTFQQGKKSSDTLEQINLSYNEAMNPQQAIELGNNIDQTLRAKLGIAPDDQNGLYMRNNAKNMNNTFAFLLVITILVTFIGFGTIVAGIIGISNIMVYIVKERTKEIGIRKALGAKPGSIVGLILQEAIFITVASGIIGVVLGIAVLSMIGDSLKDYLILNPTVGVGVVSFALFCLIISGIIAGFVPAYKAAKIKPIEALNAE